jgi:uncharacterized protein YdeI (YjbR/CyaY-like superfamily)
MRMPKTLYVAERAEWRLWLERHHATEKEVWLIYYKKGSGRPRIPYDHAVEEAICFGWIDSIVKRIDEEKYSQKFTPRTNTASWSALNKRRVSRLLKEGRMTEAGLAKCDFDVAACDDKAPAPGPKKELPIPQHVKKAIMDRPNAWANLRKLAPSYRRQYIGWITGAKREETQVRRAKEAAILLEQGKKLGMK